LPGCASISYSGGSDFTGTIYAPEADISLTGGGATAMNFSGALTANSIKLSGNYQFHYDQALCGSSCPTIISSPVSMTNCPGSTASFSITVVSDRATYQWYKNSIPLTFQTNSALILTNVTGTDAGVYSVKVSASGCSSITNNAVLTVNQSLTISNAPKDVAACAGATATFAVNATGSGVTYQWYKEANSLTGENAASLNITNVTALNAGTYSVVINGACGTPITNSASLIINQSVAISAGLVDQAVCAGSTIAFNITATGSGLSYQWFHGSALLGGQSAASLTLSNVASLDAGIYAVVVRDVCGGALTNLASLVVNLPAAILQGPASLTVCEGSPASFTVNASGSGLAYQWFHGGNLMPGQNSNTLTLAQASLSDAGVYLVTVSGRCGSSITSSANLLLNQPASITAGLADQAVCPGSTITFNVKASGTGLSYQWYHGGISLAGQSAASLTLSNLTSLDAGIYAVVVRDVCGGALTNSANLAVNEPLAILQSPASLTVCEGNPATFVVNASGTGLAYRWFRGGNTIPGAISNTLTLPQVSLADAGAFQVAVTGACGTAQTNTAMLAVNGHVSVSPMVNLFQNPGTTATFSAIATGAGPFIYVWKKDGMQIPGATLANLTIASLAFTNAGIYTVEVTGQCGTASQSATLAVNHPPVVNILSPTNGAVFFTPATFTVLAGASDVDGVVTNVEFFLFGTNKIGECSSTPYFVIPTNLTTGIYTFTAKATDNMGATGFSSPVQISVIDRPPLQTIGGIVYSPQLDFFIQTNRVFNPTYSTLNAIRIYISNLTNVPAITVHNASGYSNNIPYVETHQAIAPGSYVDIRIEYASPLRVVPNPILRAELAPVANPGGLNISGTLQRINRTFMLANRTIMTEFLTQSNRVYYIQYTHDLKKWNTATPALIGSGAYIQWIDGGEPKTDSSPANDPMRFYRLVMLP
jgi:hypothetical protein